MIHSQLTEALAQARVDDLRRAALRHARDMPLEDNSRKTSSGRWRVRSLRRAAAVARLARCRLKASARSALR